MRSSEGEVSVLEDERSHQGPHVEPKAEPGGDDLDPHRGHVGGDGVWDHQDIFIIDENVER